MASSAADRFAAHVLDLLEPLGLPVRARRMFGGLGFYAGDLFVAIGDQAEGRVWLKVDDQTRAAFEAAGGQPFTYEMPGKGVQSMAYLTPPDAALEDPEAMLPWARLGVEAARRAQAARLARARGTAARKARPTARKAASSARTTASPARGRKARRR